MHQTGLDVRQPRLAGFLGSIVLTSISASLAFAEVENPPKPAPSRAVNQPDKQGYQSAVHAAPAAGKSAETDAATGATHADVKEQSPASRPAGAPTKSSTVTVKPELTPAPAASGSYIFKDAANIVGNPDTARAILAAYGISLPVDSSKNPFLARVNFLKSTRTPQGALVSSTTAGNAQGGEPSGLFSASDVAGALGSLIAERVKQDAELLALQELANELKRINGDRRYDKPIDKLMPQSTRYLETINPAATSPSMWNVLQSDFHQDLRNTPNNLPQFLDSLHPANTAPRADQYFIDMAASLGAEIAVGGRTPYAVVDALAYQSNAFYQRQLKAQAAAGVTWLVVRQFQQADAAAQALMIFSHALTIDKKSQWQTAEQLADYLKTPVKPANGQSAPGPADPLFVLLGLSYARDSASYKVVAQALFPSSDPALPVRSLAASIATYASKGMDFLAGVATPLLTQFEKLQADEKALPATSTPTLADAEELLIDLGGLASSVTTAIDAAEPNTVSPSIKEAITQWTAELDIFAQVTTDARTGDYQAAIAALIVELPLLLPQECVNSTEAYVKGQPCHMTGGGMVDFINQKGPLIAALAEAKSGADFSAALDSYALPAGSFTQIQNETRSFTLNAYFGAEAGAEILSGNLGSSGARRVAPRLGFTAPVGIAYNWAKPAADPSDTHWHFSTGSQSVFVSALDVGAIASFRLGSGGGGQIPPVRWSNILAPGVFYVWTMRNTPFSIMVGTEYGPELRQVSTTAGNTLDRAAWQLPMIAFTFNIPLFQLSGHTDSTLNPAKK